METYLDHVHKRPDGQQVRLAARVMAATQSQKPGLVWFGGFKSDMMGTKAESLVDVAREQGIASMRFDYSGHGESDGEFTDGTISKWVAESVDIFCALTDGPQILVGSSIQVGVWFRNYRSRADITSAFLPHPKTRSLFLKTLGG